MVQRVFTFLLLLNAIVTSALFLSFLKNRKQPAPPLPTVVKIRDGDTVVLSDKRVIRYIGVDTPEKGECYSTESAELNKKLVLNKQVRLETDVNEIDNFGRTLAYVYLPKEGGTPSVMVNTLLLEKGAGTFFLDTINIMYQSEMVRAANNAHTKKEGLWSMCAVSPQTGCVVKGNVDMNDKRFYHLPTFRHYSQVVMNLEKGDRWFCSEKDAISAGFHRARE